MKPNQRLSMSCRLLAETGPERAGVVEDVGMS